jgi:hypothetical protein
LNFAEDERGAGVGEVEEAAMIAGAQQREDLAADLGAQG